MSRRDLISWCAWCKTKMDPDELSLFYPTQDYICDNCRHTFYEERRKREEGTDED